MEIKNPKIRPREIFAKITKKQKIILFGLTLLCVASVVAIFLFVAHRNSSELIKEPNPPSAGPAYKEGSGGDPNLLVSYHQEAIALWKAGKKQEAKQVAQKGLEINDKLTIAQQQSVPAQSTVSAELFAITEGNYSVE